MRLFIGLAAFGVLMACEEQSSDFGSRTSATNDFTPIALGPTEVWLDNRGQSVPEREQTSDLTTAELAARHGTPVPGVSSSAASKSAPTGPVTLAALAFTDVCIASLPSMTDAPGRLEKARARNFGAGSEGDISMSISNAASTAANNQCAISVKRQDTTEVANALVGAVTEAGYGLQPASAIDAQQAWTIVGAPAGTVLKLETRQSILGQKQTRAWIAWP